MLRIPQSHFLSPDDLATCQRVFNQICADARLDHSSLDSETLASAVLASFQRGIVDEEELLQAMRARRGQFTHLPI
ncbi:MAG: hypothetical protein EOS27_24455 [Mesorhizobium sp.]|nr:MAG: hypothetical protein EOS27_24455 [Mesorhizobium sp.]TIX22005.1 MAG: hypothetical protein E5V35_27485 [Mesorhizobium sp.]